ncbi:putative Zn-dependent peptidase [Nonomuraea thailandensis]|uniref:Zn-dependent peptidase n=1 Tax=Nonomuraea thailandensis TaxID=1188745 RepID=A0A9X2KAL4_9ACTN|nr:M16 family metallopeptidase [Nonomuraea thailandensis]MCP2365739.1 putative Zn-dependent peptidase [Nonomuraea thailandensis]
MSEVIRVLLPNGLRLVLTPDPGATMVGVSLHYGVGFRSEPVGRTGFAHLFEHLMFQGSENVAPGEHGRLVQAAGGSFNGSTGPDATNFYQTVPHSALERVFFLEADRMRAPRLTERSLATQLAVVKEEIRKNVTGKAYGRFPWPVLPQTLYQHFANTHDGYGDFGDLDSATAADCRDFFDAYYHPGNCVLSVCGDFDPGHVAGLADAYFSAIPARPLRDGHTPEPHRDGEYHQVHLDEHAPGPALALGYRLPDPQTDLTGYLAHMVLGTALTGGVSARLNRALLERDLGSVRVKAGCGLIGGPLRARDPDTFVVSAYYPKDLDEERIIAVVDAELDRLRSDGADDAELAGAARRCATLWSRAHGRVGERARSHGRLESLYGAAELTHELPARLELLTTKELQEAAGRLLDGARARVTVRPVPPDRETGVPVRPARDPGALAEVPADRPSRRALEPPPLAPLQPVQPSPLSDVVLDTGLRVVAVRSPAVPLVSLRLRIALPCADAAQAAAQAVLGAMLLRESRCPQAAELEQTGWTVVPLADTRQLVLSGDGPATAVADVLRVLAGALADPGGYDDGDVATTRTLIARQIAALAARPAAAARTALRRRLLGGQADEHAGAAEVLAVTAADLENLHATRIAPAAASLVLVGDLDPDDVLGEVAEALAPWRRACGAQPEPARGPAPVQEAGLEVIDDKSTAQTHVRFGARWPAPDHPSFPTLEVANAAFGGYFSSRLSTELREKRGLTYSARSVIEPEADGSMLLVSFEARREVADTAITEFHRLIEKLAESPFDVAEFESARDHLVGQWLAGVGSQGDLANTISGRLALGLPPTGVFEYSEKLATVRHEDVRTASQEFLAPGIFTGVALGDADSIPTYR